MRDKSRKGGKIKVERRKHLLGTGTITERLRDTTGTERACIFRFSIFITLVKNADFNIWN